MTSPRRLVENEAVFRSYNENVLNGLDNVSALATEEGHSSLIPKKTQNIYFYCECSDEDCNKRVNLSVEKYEEIHLNRNRFVVITGHDTPEVEQIIDGTADYCIVEKYDDAPENPGSLHETSLHNG